MCLPLASGRAEAGDAAGSFGQSICLFKGGFDALDDAELGDAVAGRDEVRVEAEVGEDDFELAAVAGIDDAGERGEAAKGEAAAIFDQSAVGCGSSMARPVRIACVLPGSPTGESVPASAAKRSAARSPKAPGMGVSRELGGPDGVAGL